MNTENSDIMASENDILGTDLLNEEESSIENEHSAAEEPVKSGAGQEEPEEEEDWDETLGERVWGLTEMFPDWFRNGIRAASFGSIAGAKAAYSFSRSAFWIVFSSSVILMAPVIFEVERAQMEDMQKQQQRQILLGPNAAVSGGQPHFPIPIPPASS